MRCKMCNRVLKDSVSISRGYGPECYKKMQGKMESSLWDNDIISNLSVHGEKERRVKCVHVKPFYGFRYQYELRFNPRLTGTMAEQHDKIDRLLKEKL